MDRVTVIIPVKDEEDGLRFLVENYKDSTLRKEYEIDFIFVIIVLFLFLIQFSENWIYNPSLEEYESGIFFLVPKFMF